MDHCVRVRNITKKSASQELRGKQGKPTFLCRRGVGRIWNWLAPLHAYNQYARYSRNNAPVSRSATGLKRVVYPYIFCGHRVIVLRSPLLPGNGMVRFLPSMPCRDILREPPGNGFSREERATRGAAGLRRQLGM